jgi:magnesium chelatase family protein
LAAVVKSFAVSGVDGYIVEIEVDALYGQPSISIVGLVDMAVKEARQRLEASIINAKYEFPRMKVVINLAPGDIKKSGSHFDLGMAIGLLLKTSQLETNENIYDYGFIGELSLNGQLRSCSGVLPMAMSAKIAGIKNLIVPKDNIEEAALVQGINIFGFEDLKQVVNFLMTGNKENVMLAGNPYKLKDTFIYDVDFNEVKGQSTLIEYITVAAAGGHSMIMIGYPGCGKSMLARRIPTILPPILEQESLEVTRIYSVAGLIKERGSLIQERPFRAPHHNASTNSLIGGGCNATPGEISLAHNGVLFLDEITEFNKKTLDALRQPMEDGKVTISRVNCTNSYPSDFMLIAAMNPCPCGYYGQSKCNCTDYEVLKYRQKVSGPIMDRIDIQKYVKSVDFMDLSNKPQGINSKELREKVEKARNIQAERFKDFEHIHCNASMSSALIKEFCEIEHDSLDLIRISFERFSYSVRTYNKFLKIARTFADMEASDKIRKKDIISSLMARDLDKDNNKKLVI